MKAATVTLCALAAAYCGALAVLVLFLAPAPPVDRVLGALVCAILAAVCAMWARIVWED